MIDEIASTETAFDQFWLLVSGVLKLDRETFWLINHLPSGLVTSILLVLLAALSQGIGQSVVLFINRVRPLRFILSLAFSAIIFTFTYNFWVLSTWLVANQVFQASLSLIDVIKTFGFSYAPLVFGFLMIIPYFGMPIFVTLSIWTLLAIVTGIDAIADLGFWQVFQCCIGGWLVLQISQRTIGRPLAAIARTVTKTVAGVDLVSDRGEIAEILYEGLPVPTLAAEIPNFLGDSPED